MIETLVSLSAPRCEKGYLSLDPRGYCGRGATRVLQLLTFRAYWCDRCAESFADQTRPVVPRDSGDQAERKALWWGW